MSEFFDGSTEEATRADTKCYAGLFKGCEDFLKVDDVVIDGSVLNDDVIKVFQASFPVESGQNKVQHSFESCWGVVETEWHSDACLCTLVASECGFMSVFCFD